MKLRKQSIYRGGQLSTFWPWHVLSVLGLGLALPHLVPLHPVHLLPDPSEGDTQILVPPQCEVQKDRTSNLPSALQKGKLKAEDDEQAYLARFLEDF